MVTGLLRWRQIILREQTPDTLLVGSVWAERGHVGKFVCLSIPTDEYFQ